MKLIRWNRVLATLVVLVFVDPASSQHLGGYGSNPYTGNMGRAASYNPYTGSTAMGRYSYNMYTGSYGQSPTFNSRFQTPANAVGNQYIGPYSSVQALRNPYTGGYSHSWELTPVPAGK